jgi:radical SAM superfamily enzyme YgiQ (UPF0313 family)
VKVLLVVYDNESYIHHPPVALSYIATALRDAGHNVSFYNQELYHWPESHLTEYLTKNHFDVVGLSLVAGYYPYRKMLKISEAINKVEDRPYYILGGHGPSPEPEYYLKKTSADCVVVGEGEITIVNLLSALERKKPLKEVKGIAYLDSGKLVRTERQPLIKDINTIPIPAWDLLPMDYYALFRVGNINLSTDRVGIMLSGRGCPFHCNFCYRMDKGCRTRTPENILEEIEYLRVNHHINFIQFQDELLMTSKERTVQICEAFIKANLGMRWGCNGRLNFATPKIIKLMKLAGCVFINYGIESVDDEALKAMNKNLTYKQIVRGIEATTAEGIHPGFNIIFGNIGETKEVLRKDVAFLKKYDDQGQFRTIRPVTPYPGSPLYYYALEHGLLKDVAEFYEVKHINQDLPSVNFTDLTDQEFREELCLANTSLTNNYYSIMADKMRETCKKLYLEKDAAFRGYRQT